MVEEMIKKNLRIIWLIIFIITLSGCATTTAVNHIPKALNNDPIKLVIFFDGTSNDEGSYTNIAKLYNLITLQDSTNIRTSYIKGVGTDLKVIGMIMGLGIGKDVREAYLFLSENYDPTRGDKIFIFGFSRGAYAARILTALVHVAGIPDLSKFKPTQRPSYIKEIYHAYKSKKKSITDRRKDVAAVLGYTPDSVDIEFVGLWDTVEALGIPDYQENWVKPNPRYADQLCNIKKAAHAVSIDDDRARIFTPILLTHKHLVESCKTIKIDHVVDEVWFSGAHSDVGGGYKNTHISGVSLNWMLKKISMYNLVPDNSRVYADYKGLTHDPEAGLWGLIYLKRSRNLVDYANHTEYNNNKLKIHRSVFDRLKKIKPKKFEYQWLNSTDFSGCFYSNGDGIEYIESKHCFDVVEY
ncbi:DUF2235 domain-containing protein [uncultured Desulfosarcina sp.]|uniref:DUF2235 domain-containing protein n=1 Tax=uncultured Desulfosarcina sp. TaxID=218289 RepID=UPI0029C76B3B|nr:DUF2235 domain-containing protein [uncultured Desulfosarcina sp.]